MNGEAQVSDFFKNADRPNKSIKLISFPAVNLKFVCNVSQKGGPNGGFKN